MAKKQSLGRGFDVLIPKDLDQSIMKEDKHRVQKVLITDIVPNPDQPRREFDKKSLDELASSIERHGVLQPIIVVRDKDKNGYRIVAGERRWRAAKQANLNQIPAIVRSLEELEQIELALIENVQRVDLSPLEQALSVYRLQQQFNLALETIAEKLGKAPSTVSNLTRLLQLPEAAREALRTGKITEGHARAILALKGLPEKQEELLRCIENNRWTVRQAEQFVLATKKGATLNKARTHTASETELTKRLSQELGAVVKIKHTAKGGQLIITFGSEEQLNGLAAKIQNKPE
jgi:ParB family chromosome partitioning protein